jgi:hypothetical protein
MGDDAREQIEWVNGYGFAPGEILSDPAVSRLFSAADLTYSI